MSLCDFSDFSFLSYLDSCVSYMVSWHAYDCKWADIKPLLLLLVLSMTCGTLDRLLTACRRKSSWLCCAPALYDTSTTVTRNSHLFCRLYALWRCSWVMTTVSTTSSSKQDWCSCGYVCKLSQCDPHALCSRPFVYISSVLVQAQVWSIYHVRIKL